MKSVTIIGSGNVAEAFAYAVAASEFELCEVAGRNTARVAAIAKMATCRAGEIENLSPADLYIVAVSDGAIAELVSRLKTPEGAIVVHCAGSVSLAESGADGVLYPMQSFTAGRRVDFRSVPLFIEVRRGGDLIEQVARGLSDSVVELNSERRRHLHLAAVFACNFTNAMLTACSEVLEPSGVAMESYRPLVYETIAKAFDMGDSPASAQTGAARRGDIATQQRHVEMLGERDDLADIYRKISSYIWEISKRT